jgi:hypothetical protein
MSLIKKNEFIIHFIDALRKELEQRLPEEDYLFEMQNKSWDIIFEKGKHIRGD